MSGEERKDRIEGGGAGGGGGVGGILLPILKVAGVAVVATATVVGCIYVGISLMRLRAEAVAVGVGDGGGGRVGAIHVASVPEALWSKPMTGWVKLNVSGVISSGCGVVLRDSSGKWLCGFAQKLNPNLKADEIEKDAILKALQWAMDRNGVTKLVVESDNKVIVNFVNNGQKGKSTDPFISGIKELLNNPRWKATLAWTPKQANQVAVKLAEYSRALPSFDLRHFDSPPRNCIPSLTKDAQ